MEVGGLVEAPTRMFSKIVFFCKLLNKKLLEGGWVVYCQNFFSFFLILTRPLTSREINQADYEISFFAQAHHNNLSVIWVRSPTACVDVKGT